MSEDTERNKQSGQRSKIAVFIIGIAVVIFLLIVVIVLLVQGQEKKEPKRNVVITPDNVEEAIEDMLNEEFIEPGYYSASMTNVWHFTDGDAISEDAFVENREENTNDVYFDVFLAEDEETPILQSPVIPRGAELNNIALDTYLEAGTYDCVMVYHLIDDDQNTVSTLRVGITIIVEQ